MNEICPPPGGGGGGRHGNMTAVNVYTCDQSEDRMMLGPQVTRKVRIHLGSQSVAQRDVGANKKNFALGRI